MVNTSPSQQGKHWSDNYLTVPYVDGGRDVAIGVDCWGLVRNVLHQHFNIPLLNSYGSIHAEDKVGMTNAFQYENPLFTEIKKPESGAVIAGFNGKLLIHVGVVIDANGLEVLHTSSKLGMCKCKLRHFSRLFSQVKYYVYKQ